MIKQELRVFKIHENDLDQLRKELSKWNIELYEETNNVFKFFIQTNNECYEIRIKIHERLPIEEQLAIITPYKFVKTFDDIQNQIFGKVIWNWK